MKLGGRMGSGSRKSLLNFGVGLEGTVGVW